MTLALMEVSKFPQATTAPFPGVQGDSEVRVWPGTDLE